MKRVIIVLTQQYNFLGTKILLIEVADNCKCAGFNQGLKY